MVLTALKFSGRTKIFFPSFLDWSRNMLLEIWTQRKNSLFFVCDSKKKKFITIAKKKLVWIVEHGVKENDQKSKDRSSRRINHRKKF